MGRLKRFFQGWVWVALVAAAVVLVDQLSKNWIRNNIPLNSALVPFAGLEPWFRLVHWNNTGAAFGILQGQGGIFVVIAVVVIVAVLIYLRQLPSDEWAVKLCLGLMLGGAVGNLIDRLQFGQVTDFLLFTLPVGGRVLEWPAFNVADSCIVVGVILLAFLLLREEKQRPPAPEPVEEPATPAEEIHDSYEAHV